MVEKHSVLNRYACTVPEKDKSNAHVHTNKSESFTHPQIILITMSILLLTSKYALKTAASSTTIHSRL